MPQVRLAIGGRSYDLACRAGEEAHYRELAAHVDRMARAATGALGGMSEVRTLLLAALLLADEATAKDTPPPSPEIPAAALDVLAERIERLAESLEKGAATS